MTSIKFVGPAQKEFDSLQDLATDFLDNDWPNWNNYQNPQSYIIPLLFNYKNPDFSDEAFEKYRKTLVSKSSKNPDPLITARISDEAEFLIYNCIENLIQNGIKSPFVAVHNLDLGLNFVKGQLHGLLTKIYPNLQWEKFLEIMKTTFSKDTPNVEFDFVLIGPTLGIIVIEVKSSEFTNCKHFVSRSKTLPEGYQHGLSQLRASDALLYFLQEATGISMPKDYCVRKILFTPNLEKARYHEWIRSLTEEDRNCVNEKVGDVIQVFKEDPQDLLEFFNFETDSMREEIALKRKRKLYEAYAPILAAIGLVTVQDTKDTNQDAYQGTGEA